MLRVGGELILISPGEEDGLVWGQQFVLGDFNVCAEAVDNKTAQDFVISMATMGLSQIISGPTFQGGHPLDKWVCVQL